jgi:hypothetical protein
LKFHEENKSFHKAKYFWLSLKLAELDIAIDAVRSADALLIFTGIY